MKVTVVIPNYNGINFLGPCLESLKSQTYRDFSVLVVDNGSTDGSVPFLRERYPGAEILALSENTGFCGAVNRGIRAADSPYVLLLNNDTEARPEFIGRLVAAMERGPHPERTFSVSARMLMMGRPDRVDDAGDYYCALGWAFARGKGRPAAKYARPARVFAACGGASLYRKAVFGQIGFFDEEHFAYLEDIDIGYRARIYGYRNAYEPGAEVLHAGSGSSGSRYNPFKTALSSANSVYLIGKNMPAVQVILNLPFLITGFLIKWLFFVRKGMGKVYRQGFFKGLKRCFGAAGRERRVRFAWRNLGNYARIQWELWLNMIRLFLA